MSCTSYVEDLTRLKVALIEERKSTSCIIMHVEDEERSEFATADSRDIMACWILLLTKELSYNHRVFYRAVSLLDAFLSTVKVKHRYMQCVSATCFYIAAKLEQDSDSVNRLQDTLVDNYNCDYSQRDIQRMELIIMQKLEFHLYRPTIDEFINSFHSLALTSSLFCLPTNISIKSHLSRMYKISQHIVCNHHLMKYKSSMLGLAVLGCDLKLLECDWLSTILSLQTVAQIRGGELSVCYEALAADYPRLAEQYQLTPPVKPNRVGWQNITKSVSASVADCSKTVDTGKNNTIDSTARTTRTCPLLRRPISNLPVNSAI